MANEKLPQLPSLTAITGQDLFYVVDVSDPTDDPTGSSKGITRDDILTEVNQIDFNTTATTTHLEGRISWNDTLKTLEVDTENSDVQLKVGHEMVIRVNNQTGGVLTKGRAVYINGEQGNRPTVTYGTYTGDSTSAAIVGLIADDIPNNQNGYVIVAGLLEGINTSSYTPGTPLYLFTGGTLTSTKPQAPNHDVRIAKVVVQDATIGSLYVNIQNGYELDEIHDVRITSVSENDVLVRSTYNGSPVWVNTKTMSGLTYVEATTISATTISGTTFYGDGTNLTGVLKGSGTTNYLPKWTGTTGLGNSQIQDDGTYVSISTSTALYGLQVYNSTTSSGGVGIRTYSDSGVGNQTGLISYGAGNIISGTSVGVYGFGIDGLIAIGVKGDVGVSEFGSVTTGIGGYFDGRGDGTYSYPSFSYSVQLLDGTEGVDKILQSQTSDGKANWVDPSTIQTAFNYGISYTMLTGNYMI